MDDTVSDFRIAQRRIRWTMIFGGVAATVSASAIAFAIGLFPVLTSTPENHVLLRSCPGITFEDSPYTWIYLKASLDSSSSVSTLFFEFEPPVAKRFSGCEEIAVKSDYRSPGMHFGLVEKGQQFDPQYVGGGDHEYVTRDHDEWFRLPKALFSRFDGTFQIEADGLGYPLSMTDRLIRVNVVAINRSSKGERQIPGDTHAYVNEPSSTRLIHQISGFGSRCT